MRRTFSAAAAALIALLPAAAWEASVTKNLAIQVTVGQVPTAVSFSPAGPVAVSDSAPAGTVVSAVLVTTSDAQPFAGTVSILSQTETGMTSLSSGSLPSNVQVPSISSADDGAQSVTVQACENSVCQQGTLNITVTPSGSGGDPTIGVLPSYNDVYANWKMAGMQSVGGIPNRSTVCATLTPLGGSQPDTTQINHAISACPAGQVVQLNAGTFNISAGGNTGTIFLNKGITLRGSGACNAHSGTAQTGATLTGSPYCATVINVVGGAQVGVNGCTGSGCNISTAILVGAGGGTGSWKTPTTLTADAAQGATSIQVASVSGFLVGQWVLVDELDGATWQPDPATGSGYASGGKVWAAPDWTSSAGSPATGRVAWQYHNPGRSGDDGTNVFCWYSQCSPTNSRASAELHLIKSISGNTITFDDPLTIAYRQSGNHNAQLYAPAAAFVQNAGVENLSIIGSTQGGIYFQFCAYCWSKNVEIGTWLNGGINAMYTARTEINRNFIHNATWPLPGGAEYAIDLQDATTEMYLVDTISMLAGKGMTERAGGAGTVVAYNYFDKALIAYSPAWQEMGANGSHVAGSHMTLFEGNWTHNMDNDSTHGSESYHTFFRNLSTGLRSVFTDYFPGDVQTVDDSKGVGVGRAAGLQEYNYWHAFVGNVLGTPGKTTAANGWKLNGAYNNNGANNWPGIWLLGWRDVSPQPLDPNVTTRTFRHANYDYYDSSIQWDSGTPVHNLPNSFYLSDEPSFFTTGASCTYPWPWVNPTATSQFSSNSCGGSGNPAKARFDAGTPFVQP